MGREEIKKLAFDLSGILLEDDPEVWIIVTYSKRVFADRIRLAATFKDFSCIGIINGCITFNFFKEA